MIPGREAFAAALAGIRVTFWTCLNRDHKRVLTLATERDARYWTSAGEHPPGCDTHCKDHGFGHHMHPFASLIGPQPRTKGTDRDT